MPLFFGRTNCDLQIPYKLDPNPWKQHQNWLAIERWATYFARNCGAACAMDEIQWSRPSTVSTAQSPPWQSNKNRRLTAIRILTSNADTADVVFEFYRHDADGSYTVATVTLPAGDLVVLESGLSENFGADGEFLTFACTDVGDAAAYPWTVIAYFDCAGVAGTAPAAVGVPEV